MKRLFSAAVAVSLALNAAFAWLFLAPPPVPRVAPPVTALAPVAAPPIDARLWPDLKTADLPALIDRLRAAGFPPEMVRAILSVQLDEQFAARRRALASPKSGTDFWKSLPRDPKADLALRELDREEQKLLAGLMGDPAKSNVVYHQALTFLPPDKAGAVQRLELDYQSRRSNLWTAGFNESNDRDKFKAIDQQQRDALAQLLTPAELQEYDLRTGTTASLLRDRLVTFDPSEAEFRAIYPLQAAFDDRWGVNYDITMPADQKAAREEAEKLLTTQIKAALAPDRAAQYDRATDWSYINTSQLVARLELPSDTTDRLYALAHEFEQRSGVIDEAKSSEAERTAQLAALQQEALARIAPLLGYKAGAVDAYQRHGGEWVKYLVPQPPPKP